MEDESTTNHYSSSAWLSCPRCRLDLHFMGTKKFQEGVSGFGHIFGGQWAEAFANREIYDVYACPRCGHLEFFLNGVGEQFRPR